MSAALTHEQAHLLSEIKGLTLRGCAEFFRQRAMARRAVEVAGGSACVRDEIMRYLYVEAKVGSVMTTGELLSMIYPDGYTRATSQAALRFAQKNGHLATHDGKAFLKYGKRCTGWRWHGQKKG